MSKSASYSVGSAQLFNKLKGNGWESQLAKAGLLVGVMLAILLLLSGLQRPAHAQRTDDTGPITVNYPENGEGAVVAFTGVDPEGRTVRWSLVTTETGFPDHDDFSIVGGTLTFKTPPDYENPVSAAAGSGTPAQRNVYKVTVTATDGSNPTMREVTVNVTNVDEEGVVTLPSPQPEGGVELTATLADPDGASGATLPIAADTVLTTGVTWQWARSSSRTGTFTDIKGATDAAYTPATADVGSYLRATASYHDAEGKYKSAFAVSTNPVRVGLYRNTPPVFQDSAGVAIPDAESIDRSVAENAAAGSAVGAPVVATDIGQDGRPEVLTYSLSGTDASSFDIDRATGQIKVGAGATLNFEDSDNASHTVMVTAADPSHSPTTPFSDTITVAITVTNVEEPPTIPAGAAPDSQPEGTLTSAVLSTYSATDPEDSTNVPPKPLKWSLAGADGNRFNISSAGVLTFKAVPDYEAPTSADRDNVYELKVVATDSAGETASLDVTVRVTNVEELGTLTLSTRQPQVGTRLTATLTDPDGVTGLTWLWSGSGSGANSATYTPVEGDVGSSLTATATYTDGTGASRTLTATSENAVRVRPSSNQAPTFPDSRAERSIAENTDAGVAVGAVIPAATDADADDTILTYTLSGGDADSFSVDLATRQVSTKAPLDYERKSRYTFTLIATDPSLRSARITVTINLTNADEAPEISGDAPGEYAENGTGPAATFTARDPERASVTWSLNGDDAGDFSITGGALRFTSPPDYEAPAGSDTDNTYEVTVEATDHGGMVATQTVTVTVTNVDEDGEVTLSSLQPQDGVALTARLTDPDGDFGDALPITAADTDLSDGATWQWARSTNKRTWTDIKGAAAATYTPTAEDVGVYLRAMASYDDREGKYKSASGVSDNTVRAKIYVNTDPVFQDEEGEAITTTTRSVAEDTGPRVAVGDPVTATDIGENGSQELLDYSLSGADASSFDIDGATGQIRVGTGTTLDFETKSSYTVTVRATDPERATGDIPVTITVTNVEERPTITDGDVTIRRDENTAIDTVLSTYMASDDEDDNDSPEKDLTWSLSGADADDFCIDPNTDGNGELTFNNPPDYEAPTDTGGNNRYEVTVIATDSEGNTASRAVTVTVINVNEDGEVTLSTLQPQVGISLTATLTDPDGRISGTTWEWASEPSDMGDCPVVDHSSWVVITGLNARSATYRPVGSDTEGCLRATATYTDAEGSSKTAAAVSDNRVLAKATGNVAPVFRDQDPNTPGVQNTTTTIDVAEDVAYGDVEDQSTNPGNVDDPVEAVDADTLTYSLGGTDVASFTIVRSSGQIQVAPGVKLDYETKRTYTVTVTATDPSLEAATITVTIRVTAVNEAPVVSRRPLSITGRTSIDFQENGTGTVAVYTASGLEAASVRWSLTGTDAGDFSISGGRLTFRGSPNYEAPADQGTDNVYNVTVRAVSGTHTATQDVTVRVDNEDEDGAVTLSPSQAVVRIELTASLTDPDGGSGDTPPVTATETDLTQDAAWQWSRSPNGSTGWTNISGATSRTYIPVASDIGSYLRVTARYADAHGSGKGATSTPIEVFAVLSNGVVTLSPSQPEVGVDMTASLTDPDGGITGLTWQWARSLDGSTGWTDIPGATSATYRPVQADAGTYLRATASYSDAQASGQRAHEVSLRVPGSQPVVAVSLSSLEAEVGVQLTASLTGPVGVITGLSWQWSRSENGITGWTEIADGTSASYTPVDADEDMYLRVTARYNDAQGFGQRVRSTALQVIGSRGNGVVTLSSTTPTVGVGLTATLTDPDGGVTGLTWQWARSADGSTGWTNISGATSASYTPVSADEGMYLRATAAYTDAEASGQTAVAVTTAATAASQADLLTRYDADGNGQIDRDEAIKAVQDYFANRISRDEALEVIRLYFSAASS